MTILGSLMTVRPEDVVAVIGLLFFGIFLTGLYIGIRGR